MLHLVQSNQLESLADRLLLVMREHPADPLAPETVVVQNTGMARWLSQYIAARAGIAANLECPLPARFIWQVFATQLEMPEAESGFDRKVLFWRVMELLAASVDEPAFGEVKAYLQDDPDGIRLFHLAGRVTDLFDQYLVFRPAMLLEWEQGREKGWQAALWRRLTDARGQHRAALYERLAAMSRESGLNAKTLPARVSLFGISSLAPVYLDILHAISQVTEVYLFHPSPCRHYWADLASGQELARRRTVWRRGGQADVSSSFETGNPLLASYGRVGREFAAQLAGMEVREEDTYVEPEAVSLLACVQRDILELNDATATTGHNEHAAEDDRSIQFHSCYSRMREVQVLHDRLLELIGSDPSIRPGDILVMAPDVESYAAAVRAVFGSVSPERHLPWSLADRAARQEQPVIETFLRLLDLAESRCTGPEVMALLETGPVRRRFQIDEDALSTVRQWLRESGICWGFDSEHRRQHDLAMTRMHSWSFGMDRLLLGYMSGRDGGLVGDIAPCGSPGAEESLLLGRFIDCIERLRTVGSMLRKEHVPEEWSTILLRILDEFFDPGGDEAAMESLAALRDTLCDLAGNCREAGYTGSISYPVLLAWLHGTLSIPSGGQPFLGGRVTICNMVPMRSVPFKIVCLLGMNDSDFPRGQNAASFDLMAADPKPGDRDRRSDDRYLFLEALLSARQVLYLSWVGKDVQDDSERVPSVVVADLLDYLRRGYGRTESGQEWPRIVNHPLQPFSRRCYESSSPSWSFAPEWYPAGATGGGKPFIGGRLPPVDEMYRIVDVRSLKRFWAHPVRYFLQERLGIRLRDEDRMLPESEMFVPDQLERYLLADRLVGERLAGVPAPESFARLRAEGRLPHAGFGENLFRELDFDAAAIERELAGLMAGERAAREVGIGLDGFTLTGWLDGLYDGKCVRYRPATLKGKDMVHLWIDHLILCCLAKDPDQASIHVARDETLVLYRVDNPLPLLGELLEGYWQGLCAPLHFFPDSARAWAETGNDERRDREAANKWYSSFNKWNECDDEAYRIVFQGSDPLNDEFRRLAAMLYFPLLDAREAR